VRWLGAAELRLHSPYTRLIVPHPCQNPACGTRALTRHPRRADASHTSSDLTGSIFRRRPWALARRARSGHGYISTPTWEAMRRWNTAEDQPRSYRGAPPINPRHRSYGDPSHLAVRYPPTSPEPEKRDLSGCSGPPAAAATPPGHSGAMAALAISSPHETVPSDLAQIGFSLSVQVRASCQFAPVMWTVSSSKSQPCLACTASPRPKSADVRPHLLLAAQ